VPAEPIKLAPALSVGGFRLRVGIGDMGLHRRGALSSLEKGEFADNPPHGLASSKKADPNIGELLSRNLTNSRAEFDVVVGLLTLRWEIHDIDPVFQRPGANIAEVGCWGGKHGNSDRDQARMCMP
jgi:hypothetical protein